jgi:hypothetical protein
MGKYSEQEIIRRRECTRQARLGVPKPPEQRKKMSEARLGTKDSEITKSRKSEAQMNYLARLQIVLDDNPSLCYRDCQAILKLIDKNMKND